MFFYLWVRKYHTSSPANPLMRPLRRLCGSNCCLEHMRLFFYCTEHYGSHSINNVLFIFFLFVLVFNPNQVLFSPNRRFNKNDWQDCISWRVLYSIICILKSTMHNTLIFQLNRQWNIVREIGALPYSISVSRIWITACRGLADGTEQTHIMRQRTMGKIHSSKFHLSLSHPTSFQCLKHVPTCMHIVRSMFCYFNNTWKWTQKELIFKSK